MDDLSSPRSPGRSHGRPHGGAHRVAGGKPVTGAAIGILMLEARFPRIPGDTGNAATWPFPVHYRIVRGASPDRVVRHRAEGLVDGFIAAARELVAMGADGLTTTCGFLSLHQADLAAAAGVPVATSSLMQWPAIQALLPPGRRPGIVTISAASLTADHLTAAGVPADAPVVGTDETGLEFSRAILDDRPEMDLVQARRDVVEAAQRLVREHADVGAVLLECTNMAPYAHAVARATGLPVFDMVSYVRWFQQALRPPAFPPPDIL